MIKILFICHGNICRSPMAEYVMKHLVAEAGLADAIYIESAATSTEEIGNGVHHGTRRLLDQHHIPCPPRRARQITARDWREFDYLICMDGRNISNARRQLGEPQGQLCRLLDFAGRPGQDIADPWYTGDFELTYDDVLQGCTALLAQLQEEL
ncbi:MAG: low molecular weight phosphotyrosine protein phosphatase [Firmicutes bacterium]|nr:low molecular weight phosphotyrosine protein phosphatase [Bacillota bacterium]